MENYEDRKMNSEDLSRAIKDKNNKFIYYEPKYCNKYLVEFPEEFQFVRWCVTNINKPKFTNGEWENIKLEFTDPIGPSTSQSLYRVVEYLIKKKNSGDNSMFDIKIQSLDPTGVVIDEWIIKIKEILTINFGDLDYQNNDILKPYLIIKPRYCELNF
jgi:hypothetical protein